MWDNLDNTLVENLGALTQHLITHGVRAVSM